MTSRHLIVGAALGAGLLASTLTIAQSAPTRVRGVITSLSGGTLTVASREGPTLSIMLAENARVVAVARATLADIRPGTFVGVAAMPRPDGTQLAIEVLIFPEAMRGAGEGHRPWDLLPESTMTNATVAETVTKTDGPTLTLTYKDGQKIITVPPEAPIVTFIPADRGDLKPGARIFSTVTKTEAGALTAASVTVGKDGVDPPM
ncbi:hypothetical protein [uncultured Enterovirga sp.]|uniref:hypothetical protein n=1 Tax=uncultured Enterovirga sp. TaxID=2026352 RepID=UPI0035CACD8C